MEPIKTKVEQVSVTFGDSINKTVNSNITVDNPVDIINKSNNVYVPTAEDYDFNEEYENVGEIIQSVEPELKVTPNTTVTDFFNEHGNNSNGTFGVDQHILANLTSGDVNLADFNLNDILYDSEDETKALVLFLEEAGALSTEEEAQEFANALATGSVNTSNVEFINALILYIAEGSANASQEEITKRLIALCSNLNQNNKFNYLLDKLKAQGFSEQDALFIMQNIDCGTGVCSYAATVNAIFAQYMNNPDKFEEIFGFPMFDEDGTLNGEELLLELYLFANSVENGGNLFVQDPNDPSKRTVIYDPNNISETMKNQVFILTAVGINEQILIDFIASKQPNLTFNCGSSLQIPDGQKVIDTVQGLLDQGKPVAISIIPKNANMPVFMTEIKDDGTKAIATINGGHAVYVTGITEDGDLIISSWGKKYIISAKDLDASNTIVNTMEITVQQQQTPILIERNPEPNGGN